MFRRTDESEWSRFAKGGSQDAPDSPPADAADLPPAAGPPGGGVPRPTMPDVNVTLTRPTPPAPAPPPPSLGSALGDQGETLVGRDSSVEGTIRSDHSIRIQGSAQGEIESKGSVVVEEGARVNAKVTAAEIVVSGELNGQVYSSGRVEIRPRGTLTGEIHAPSLVIHEDAIFEGQVQMKGRGGPGDGGDRETSGGAPGRRIPSAGTPQGRGAPPAE